jgi:HEPN domain-containing protein
MNTREMALGYILNAEGSYDQAIYSYEKGNYSLAVRRAQECVELSLKALLRFSGIEYPKDHDVGEVLLKEKGKFTEDLQTKVEYFASVSSDLARKRGPALYGYEKELRPPSSLFAKEDAEQALKDAKNILDAINGYINYQHQGLEA